MGKHFEVDSRGFVTVYTDGSCFGAGTPEAKAVIGVWFGEDSRFNVSAPVVSPADNNIAEIQAVTKAAQGARDAEITNLLIYTDSDNVMKNYTEEIPKWNKNGWITDLDTPVEHKDELQKMESALKQLTVEWKSVTAHGGVYGNEVTDKLARDGRQTLQTELAAFHPPLTREPIMEDKKLTSLC